MAFWMKQSLWEHEVRDVIHAYPDAEWRDIGHGKLHTRAWRLTMTPIPNREELGYVLADLELGKTVAIGQQGKISHLLKCEIPLGSHTILLPQIRLLNQAYVVELIYRPLAKNAAWPVQPLARIINPEISAQTYPKHPHMYRGNGSWACPLSPQDKRWTWGKRATVSYLDQVAIWLLKTAVWIATGAGTAGLGRWIGQDTSHEPDSLLHTIELNDPCWCGSGLYYKKCHMRDDALRAIEKNISESLR